MTITITDSNIIVLYGDGAVARYSELVNRWSRLISSTQWDGFQFFLAASSTPELELEESAKRLVDNRNTVFYLVYPDGTAEGADPAPDTNTYHNIIFDKVKTGTVRLHVIVDTAGKDFRTEWLQQFVRSAMDVSVLTTTCFYYLLFDRNSFAGERERFADLLKAQEGTTFLLGDTNDAGGRVPAEDRMQATVLAVLMNSAGLLPVGSHTYSLGYSALNANGSELRRLAESTACRSIYEELGKTVDSLSGDIHLRLLPENVDSVAGLTDWLRSYVKENMRQPEPQALRNAWVTIRMSAELSSTEALKRMQRFADLNYTGKENASDAARELAWQTENRLRAQMRSSVATAALSDRVLREIADAFGVIASDNAQPVGVTYPPKPFKPLGFLNRGAQNEEYLQKCKAAVMQSIREYILRRNVGFFAKEMQNTYLRLADWVRAIRGESDTDRRHITARELLEDLQKELDSADYGNASRLATKYRHYNDALNAIRPQLSVLTAGIQAQYFCETGELEEKSWRDLVRSAARNLERQMSSEFRGDFFRIISAEFSTPEERERFFDEYLKSGPRMYRHLQAEQSSGTEHLLVDDRLTDKWFMGKKLYEVKTDNAENLTVYPLGEMHKSWWYLESDDKAYFLNREGSTAARGSGGRNLFSSARNNQPKATAPVPRRGLFDTAGSPAREIPTAANRPAGMDSHPVRLNPDKNNHYRLYWEWCGNDETAMVEMFQYGEKIGQVAVIPVRRFKDNGNNMNVTDEVMGGRPLPAGTLTVTIRDARQNIYIDSAEVTGRRDVVRYKVNNARLQLQPEKRGLVEKVVLRTTETDGTQMFFPLYPSDGEKPWLYEGLSLSDGCVVEDPTNKTGFVFPVPVE